MGNEPTCGSVKKSPTFRGSARIESGRIRNLADWIGLSHGSDKEVFKYHGSGRVTLTRPQP